METLTKKLTVKKENLASVVGSGNNDELTTVGTAISIEHTSPTPLGAEVEAEARLVKTEGRLFFFELTARDNAGEIAKGTHTRVSVKAEKFQKKADGKFDEI